MNGKDISENMIIARDEYISMIRAELLGPGSEFNIPDAEHELISSSPLSRYSIGILFPQGNHVEQDNDETMPIGEVEEAIILEVPENYSTTEEKVENKKEKIREFDETVDENLDEEINMATQFKPSSMGVTFLVKGDANKVYCNASFATYKKAQISDCAVYYEPENSDTYMVPPELSHIMSYDKEHQMMKLISGVNIQDLHRIFEQGAIPANEYDILKKIAYRLHDYLKVGYVRMLHHVPDIEIDFSNSDYFNNEDTSALDGTSAKIVALRTPVSEDVCSITIMLMNDKESFPAKAQDCLFQSEIEICSDNNHFVFIESNPNSDIEYLDDEEKSLNLLYRHKKIYGTGLGVSVDWDISDMGMGTLWTDFFPIKEIPAMNFSLPQNDCISDKELSMKYLSDLSDSSKEQKLSSLTKLVQLYVSWVNELKVIAASLDERYSSAAIKNIQECTNASIRMHEGIETLRSNDYAYNAFALANRAMFMQRIHIRKQTDMSRVNADRYPGDEEIADWLLDIDYQEEEDGNCRWRPFQIAFLLMDINSIVYDQSDDRSLVDLIWFPTGGGKTEAYLGLTAFTIFYRKLSYPDTSDGTAVMMRYTLRLLAAQQFTRAATLICACEYIRQDSQQKKHNYPAYPLGKKSITIGLWIGGLHIPNKNTGKNSAEYHLDKLYEVGSHYQVKTAKERHNKFQVLKCPWCGTKMVKDNRNQRVVGEWGYAMSGKHFYLFCPHEECTFTKKLPIQIIDEELYDAPPTLLFGTVDKFALMAWDGKISSFFGTNSVNRSPELIIQDELHLISGALGTMVGLYETAVDGLSSMKGVKPKVIASTATIRKAKEQCSVLYNRQVVQFPAPGLDAEDSFFAREDVIDYSKGKYGRKYVGIMPSGRTKAMTEIRTMAALLQKAYTMESSDEVKDKLWTLTVYFNSLKDLGKASTLVDDDVKDFIIRTANRMFTKRRLIVNADELTSRVSTTELNETLDKLERIEYSKENIEKNNYASNVLLATNMISVGIDVARLNVMLMVGQPKLTSEYIQASSRVGRLYPGVAFIQYDATKSRDRSHYERFKPYHDSFYRFVEPTGATPFSKPARERALHAVFTAMLRQKVSLDQDNMAVYFDKERFAADIQDIEAFIINRIREVNDRSESGLRDDLDDVRLELQEFIGFWQELVDKSQENGDKSLVFGRKYIVVPPAEGARRLLKQYNSPGKDDARETLTSMRNVDTSVKGSIVIWED
ncbi:helicase-related protein [Anaerosporobacter sp.]|uniref:helicase-related protein n=1 Tax=Anaerosporobacter sp. TaxID=1872529 RepID=UPI00286EE49A|nr:helicase-related protein [Anaerosporobacter sp.]